jgi:superfamily I DNA/RNA helicase
MPELISFHSGLILSSRAYCAVLLDSIKRYLQSDDEEPGTNHIFLAGNLEMLSAQAFEEFARLAILHIRGIWESMRSGQGALPLGHDGYLKLWALSKPRAEVDYIMVDEAQDLNPVMLGVLKAVQCPVIYVGDPYQQIYDWRGAVNAMEQTSSPHSVLLSQSFRFGEAIAEAATAVITRLGAKDPVRGLPAIKSYLAPATPDAIIARRNVGVIGEVLKCVTHGISCHVLGGTHELERLLLDVQRIKLGSVAQSPELLGFNSWKDVMTHSGKPEGEHLRSLVTLVQEYGEGAMLKALGNCNPNEAAARVVCTTAHKAKGREWGNVRVNPDFEVGFARAATLNGRSRVNDAIEAESRVFYVAMTRAKYVVDLPKGLMTRFQLKGNHAERVAPEVLGRGEVRGEIGPPSTRKDPVAISPYHSPQKDESREMTWLRKNVK